MKRCFLCALSLLVLLSVWGCKQPIARETSSIASSEPTCTSPLEYPPPNQATPSFIVNRVLYFTTGLSLDIEASEKDYEGRITTSVDSTKLPTEDNQTNQLYYMDNPYVKYEDGYALLTKEGWVFFKDSRKAEDGTYRGAIMLNDTLYIYSEFDVHPRKTSEKDYAGRITSLIDISELPAENEQTNHKRCLDAPYVKYEDGYALLVNERWVFFGLRGMPPKQPYQTLA